MKKNAGFTLIELMISIAIFAIISGMGVYSYLSGMPERRVIKSVRELYSGIQKARSEAVGRGQDVTITFDQAADNYTITFLADIDGSVPPPIVHNFPDYINLYSVTGGGSDDAYIFNSRGMKQPGVNGIVRIQYTDAGPLRRGIRVTTAGGISMIDETSANW